MQQTLLVTVVHALLTRRRRTGVGTGGIDGEQVEVVACRAPSTVSAPVAIFMLFRTGIIIINHHHPLVHNQQPQQW
jgi:hypothetical protein